MSAIKLRARLLINRNTLICFAFPPNAPSFPVLSTSFYWPGLLITNTSFKSHSFVHVLFILLWDQVRIATASLQFGCLKYALSRLHVCVRRTAWVFVFLLLGSVLSCYAEFKMHSEPAWLCMREVHVGFVLYDQNVPKTEAWQKWTWDDWMMMMMMS